MTAKRSWSGEEKLRVVLDGPQPNANVEAACRAAGIHSSQFYMWKAAAIEGMKAWLANYQGAVTQHQRQEIARRKRLIANQAVALQVFNEELTGLSVGKNDGGSWR